MVDEAPAADAVLPDLAELIGSPPARVLVAHNAAFDRRVLRQAFERAGLRWPDPPTLCTVALARRFAPLVRQRRLAALADALGVEVHTTHRALADAETCARVFCALFGRLCAHAADRRRRARGAGPGAAPAAQAAGRAHDRAGRRDQAPPAGAWTSRALPDEPGVYIFRNAAGQVLYVGKSVAVRTRARSHFAPSAPAEGWTEQAALVDHRTTNSELGALVLEHRLIKELRPPGNVIHKHDDAFVYLRCRLDIAYPVLEVAREPAAGRAVTIGPLRSRAAAVELKEQLDSLFGLRHCGRKLRLRPWPSAYGQMGRCMSPCLNDLDPNLYRRKLDEALALFTGAGDGGAALLAHIDAQMRAAAAGRALRARRLAAPPPRADRRARQRARRRAARRRTPARGSCWRRIRASRATTPSGSSAAASRTGTCLDRRAGDVHDRTLAALRRARVHGAAPAAGGRRIAEARIVQTWLAGRAGVPALELAPAPGAAELAGFVAAGARAARALPAGSGERQLDDLRPWPRPRRRRCRRAPPRGARAPARSGRAWGRRASSRSCRRRARRAAARCPTGPGRRAAGRAGGGWACRGRTAARRSPGRRSSPS